jgi:dethiobiotin synthetase
MDRRMTRLFVAGAHTEIGKTHVACALIRAARAAGLSVDAFKPVVSGIDPATLAESDPGRLLAALGRPLTAKSLAAISPWRFAAPLAPPMAAALESRPLPLAPLAEACQAWLAASSADLTLIEGVGGLMSPIADHATCLDLLAGIDAPTLLVGGAYLGAISHTLTALEVMRSRGRAPLAVVVSEDAGPDAPDFAQSVALVAEHAGPTPVLAARRRDEAWAGELLSLVRAA